MTAEELRILEAKAMDLRIKTIDAIGFLGVGHIGGSLSLIELLTILYYRHLKHDPADPRLESRDRLVLSKGHAGPALYSTLADRGFFPEEWLHTLNKGGTRLPSHCDRSKTPGIDMTTGSLGQGFSAACGIAKALKIKKNPAALFAIIGDGESNEGQIWEAAMFAAHNKLDNIIAFTDCNKLQIDGFTNEVLDLENLDGKWAAFGWHTQRINGHDFEALDKAILTAKAHSGQPHMIVMDTIKGKGASFCEGLATNHNMAYSYEKALEVIAEIRGGK
ncbi:MAG: transketolase [Spirochaetes bacterium]|nr:transketolase [Spirochaetota bacterium]MBU0953856.1 transketolase [Spirochaetota bacterium]